MTLNELLISLLLSITDHTFVFLMGQIDAATHIFAVSKAMCTVL